MAPGSWEGSVYFVSVMSALCLIGHCHSSDTVLCVMLHILSPYSLGCFITKKNPAKCHPIALVVNKESRKTIEELSARQSQILLYLASWYVHVICCMFFITRFHCMHWGKHGLSND